MRLHTLSPRPGAKHRRKRVGCGESSGHGKTSGKGHKGQKARSGGSIRLGFEGGQMPLIRRVPKRGFNNAAFKLKVAFVNLENLEAFDAGSTVNEDILRSAGLIRGEFDSFKILGRGVLTKRLTIVADAYSSTAKAQIEQLGGTAEIRQLPLRS